MKLTESKIIDAVNEYIDTELTPLMANMRPLDQFALGATLGIFRRKAQTVLRKFLNGKLAHTLDLVSDDGAVDVETAYIAASESLRNVGSVELASVRFTNADLDKLYNILRKHV